LDLAGIRIALLDTTVENSSIGWLDNAQLEWLDKELKRLKKGTAAAVVMRHPPEAVVNLDELQRVLSAHNVLAVFSLDRSERQKVNGTRVFSAEGDLALDADPKQLVVLRPGMGVKRTEVVATLPRVGLPRRRIAFLWDDAGLSILLRRRALAELRVGDAGAHDDKVRAEYSIDDGPRRPMTRDERDKESVSFLAQWETKGFSSGAHTLHLWFTAPDGELFTRQESFVVEQTAGSPRRTWEYVAEDGVQAGVAADSETVVIADVQGRITGIRADNGKRRWQHKATAGVVHTPVVEKDTVYTAAVDGSLTALDMKSGRVRWKVQAAGIGYGEIRVAAGVLIVPDASGQPQGFSTADGRPTDPPRVSVLPAASDNSPEISFRNGVLSYSPKGGPVMQYRCDPGEYLGRPAVVGRTVYTAGLNRMVVAVQFP
jgi:outer membrane protein assembly factor BamB